MNAVSLQRLPPMWQDGLLVYWQSEPTGDPPYPNSPFELLAPNRVYTAVIYALDGQSRRMPSNTALEIDEVVNFVMSPEVSGRRRVYSIHTKSMLARLVRWHALKFGVDVPPSLKPEAIVDLVDAVNAPAVLAVMNRHSFNPRNYVELLNLSPEAGLDRETGLLVDMIKRYAH